MVLNAPFLPCANWILHNGTAAVCDYSLLAVCLLQHHHRLGRSHLGGSWDPTGGDWIERGLYLLVNLIAQTRPSHSLKERLSLCCLLQSALTDALL